MNRRPTRYPKFSGKMMTRYEELEQVVKPYHMFPAWTDFRKLKAEAQVFLCNHIRYNCRSMAEVIEAFSANSVRLFALEH